jgi:hypothetical protein
VQAFEPGLTAELAVRWPDRVTRVLAHDTERAWLLSADAGTEIRKLDNDPEFWLRALPRYAELQLGEVVHAADHLAHGVPDMRLQTLPRRYEQFVRSDLPIAPEEVARLRRFGPRFVRLCEQLGAEHPVSTIQHDDLHDRSLYLDGDTLRVLDWGDASIAHPFASLVVTFRVLEEDNGLAPDDPWFRRLRDAYLQPWGRGLEATFERALRVGMVAQMAAWARHRDAMPSEDRPAFDEHFGEQLRRVLRVAVDGGR